LQLEFTMSANGSQISIPAAWCAFYTAAQSRVKGTVARDFWPLVFFMNRPHMGP
jgi:hypothetical protein